MDFSFKGISWAGNIYQKLEKICVDNAIVQNPSKCLDVVEQIRKVIDGVAGDWLYNSDAHAGDVCPESFVNNAPTMVFETFNVGLDNSSVENSTSIQFESAVPSMGHITPATAPASSQNLSQGGSCDKDIDKFCSHTSSSNLSEATETDCSFDAPEESKDVLGPLGSPSDLEDILLPADDELSTPDKKELERENVFSEQISSVEMNGVSPLQEIQSCPSHPENEHGQYAEPEKSGDCGQLPQTCSFQTIESLPSHLEKGNGQQTEAQEFVDSEQLPEIIITENAAISCKEVPNGQNLTSLLTKVSEKFEDVNLDDFSSDDEDYELAMISQHACREKSFKRKLKDALMSKMKFRSRRVSMEPILSSNEIMRDRPVTAASSVLTMTLKTSNSSLSSDCNEFLWELV